MTKDFIGSWTAESPERERLLAQEELILAVAADMERRMESLNISKRQIADRLGKSKAFISQILDGSRNMTLRTLSDLAWALNANASVRIIEKTLADEWEIAQPDSAGCVIAVRRIDVDASSAANELKHWRSVDPTEMRAA